MLNKHIRARKIAVLQPEYQTAAAVSSGSGFAVVTNRLYGAALEGLHALGDLFLGRGLFVDVGIAAFVMTLKRLSEANCRRLMMAPMFDRLALTVCKTLSIDWSAS